jgi:hypothetical protein
MAEGKGFNTVTLWEEKNGQKKKRRIQKRENMVL